MKEETSMLREALESAALGHDKLEEEVKVKEEEVEKVKTLADARLQVVQAEFEVLQERTLQECGLKVEQGAKRIEELEKLREEEKREVEQELERKLFEFLKERAEAKREVEEQAKRLNEEISRLNQERAQMMSTMQQERLGMQQERLGMQQEQEAARQRVEHKQQVLIQGLHEEKEALVRQVQEASQALTSLQAEMEKRNVKFKKVFMDKKQELATALEKVAELEARDQGALEAEKAQCKQLLAELDSSKKATFEVTQEMEASKAHAQGLVQEVEASKTQAHELAQELDTVKAQSLLLSQETESLKALVVDLQEEDAVRTNEMMDLEERAERAEQEAKKAADLECTSNSTTTDLELAQSKPTIVHVQTQANEHRVFELEHLLELKTLDLERAQSETPDVGFLQQDLEQARQQVDELEQAMQVVETAKKRLEEDHVVLEETKKELERELLEVRVQSQHQVDTIQTRLDQVLEEVNQSQESRSRVKELELVVQGLETQAREDQVRLEAVQASLQASQVSLQEHHDELAVQLRARDNVESTVSTLEETVRRLQADMLVVQGNYEKAEKKAEELDSEVLEYTDKVVELEGDVQAWQTQCGSVQAELDQVRQCFDEASSQLTSTREELRLVVLAQQESNHEESFQMMTERVIDLESLLKDVGEENAQHDALQARVLELEGLLESAHVELHQGQGALHELIQVQAKVQELEASLLAVQQRAQDQVQVVQVESEASLRLLQDTLDQVKQECDLLQQEAASKLADLQAQLDLETSNKENTSSNSAQVVSLQEEVEKLRNQILKEELLLLPRPETPTQASTLPQTPARQGPPSVRQIKTPWSSKNWRKHGFKSPSVRGNIDPSTWNTTITNVWIEEAQAIPHLQFDAAKSTSMERIDSDLEHIRPVSRSDPFTAATLSPRYDAQANPGFPQNPKDPKVVDTSNQDVALPVYDSRRDSFVDADAVHEMTAKLVLVQEELKQEREMRLFREGQQDDAQALVTSMSARVASLEKELVFYRGQNKRDVFEEEEKKEEERRLKEYEWEVTKKGLVEEIDRLKVEIKGNVQGYNGVDQYQPGIDSYQPGIDSYQPGIDSYQPGIDSYQPNMDPFQQSIDGQFQSTDQFNPPPNDQFQPPNDQFNPPNDQFQPPNDQFNPPNDQFQSTDQFNPPNDQFQPPNDQFNPPNDQFQPPNDQFNPPNDQFQSTDQFNPPNDQFQPPNDQFNPPNDQFQPPNDQFNPPNDQFQSTDQFNPPNDQFQPPNDQFNPPNDQFQPPNDQFNPPPNDQFNPPNDQFNPPNDQFNPPNDQFNPPNDQFNQFAPEEASSSPTHQTTELEAELALRKEDLARLTTQMASLTYASSSMPSPRSWTSSFFTVFIPNTVVFSSAVTLAMTLPVEHIARALIHNQ